MKKNGRGGESSFAQKEMSAELDRRIAAELAGRRRMLEWLWDECDSYLGDAPEGQLHVMTRRGYSQYHQYTDFPIDGGMKKKEIYLGKDKAAWKVGRSYLYSKGFAQNQVV